GPPARRPPSSRSTLRPPARCAARASSGCHLVDADHAALHVVLDVAVVEPRAGRILAPANEEAVSRPQLLHVLEAMARPDAAPAVTVDVEGVVVGAERQDVPLHEVAYARVEHRRVPDERPPVDALEVPD